MNYNEICTESGTVIISPKDKIGEVIEIFEQSNTKWNVFKINNGIYESLNLFKGSIGRETPIPTLVVCAHANAIAPKEWSKLTMRCRLARHFSVSYLFGFNTSNEIPEKLISVAKVNLFISDQENK
jgi:hypothetical protein